MEKQAVSERPSSATVAALCGIDVVLGRNEANRHGPNPHRVRGANSPFRPTMLCHQSHATTCKVLGCPGQLACERAEPRERPEHSAGDGSATAERILSSGVLPARKPRKARWAMPYPRR